MTIEIDGLSKFYGPIPAVHELDLTIADGEFLVILGPSGCGKTTSLRCLAGLEKPDRGEIRIGSRTMFSDRTGVSVAPEDRNIGMIFQSYALWPHMSVFENVAFPLRARRKSNAEIRRRVAEMLAMVGLEELEDRSVSFLSGGQMQRVALARALAYEPTALLLDEPLSNLDLKLRQRLRIELKDIQRKSGATSVFVTHDQGEAAALGDRIVVMSEGKVLQTATPENLFSRPANRFVAEFLGIPNLFRFKITAKVGASTYRGVVEDRIEIRASCSWTVRETDSLYVWFRPESLQVLDGASDGDTDTRFVANILNRSFTGTHYQYEIAVAGMNKDLVMNMVSPARQKLNPGESIAIGLSADEAHVVPDK